MPLDAARDGLIAVRGQLIMLLAQRNSALEARVSEMEDRLAAGAGSVAELGELLDAAVGR
jgi:BMFP domain-containing protein YqiC